MEEALIQYKNVEIHQQELCVLSGVNLELHKGEFVYLIGKVGSGKTSLLKTLLQPLQIRNQFPAAQGKAQAGPCHGAGFGIGHGEAGGG